MPYGLLDLEEMVPGLPVAPDRREPSAIAAQGGGDRGGLDELPIFSIPPLAQLGDPKSTELARARASLRFGPEALPVDPREHRRHGGSEQTSDARGWKARKVAGPFPGGGSNFDHENAAGRHEALGVLEQLARVGPSESERVPEEHYLRPRAPLQGKSQRVRPDPVRDGLPTAGILPCPGNQFQHLLRDIERDRASALSAHERKETPRSRSEVDRPAGADGVTEEKALPKLTVEVALSRTLVAQELSSRSIGVEAAEPVGGGTFRLRSRRGVRCPCLSHEPAGGPEPIAFPTLRLGVDPFIGGPLIESGIPMPYYECPTCGGGYVIDVPPSARPMCDRDGARLKRTSDVSYSRNAREV
jgi:hypothetical protein